MATKRVKQSVRKDGPSRIKVPHIGPRPRSNKPTTSQEDELEKKRLLRAIRKK